MALPNFFESSKRDLILRLIILMSFYALLVISARWWIKTLLRRLVCMQCVIKSLQIMQCSCCSHFSSLNDFIFPILVLGGKAFCIFVQALKAIEILYISSKAIYVSSIRNVPIKSHVKKWDKPPHTVINTVVVNAINIKDTKSIIIVFYAVLKTNLVIICWTIIWTLLHPTAKPISTNSLETNYNLQWIDCKQKSIPTNSWSQNPFLFNWTWIMN